MLIKSIIVTIFLTTISMVVAIPSFSQDLKQSIVLSVGRYQGDSPAWREAEEAGPTFWLRAEGWDLPDIGQFSAPALGDLDADGDVDALVGSSQGNCWAYKNVGSNSSPVWQRRSAWDAPDIGYNAVPDLADIDGDEDLDLVVGNGGGEVQVFENTENDLSPVWTRHQAWEIKIGSQYASPRVVDLDGDTLADLLVGTRFDGVKAYRNNGTASSPAWLSMPNWNAPSVGERTTVAVADINGDGTLDLMLGNKAGDVLGYANAGSVVEPVWQAHPGWNLGNVGGYGYSVPYIVGTSGVMPPPPPPPPPPVATKQITLAVVRFAFHYHNVLAYDIYGPADYLIIDGLLKKGSQETFLMPFDRNVTVTLEIPDPLDQSKQKQIFEQTISAGTVRGAGSGPYRFTSRNPGIWDLRLSQYSSDAVYLYLEVEKVMFLPELKNASCYKGCELTPLEYRNRYILPIPNFTITVAIGGTSWKGEAALTPGNYNQHYQQLILRSQ